MSAQSLRILALESFGERCARTPSHDPATLEPRGKPCGKVATQVIFWKDGRYSPSCGQHGMSALDADARPLVLAVHPTTLLLPRIKNRHLGGGVRPEFAGTFEVDIEPIGRTSATVRLTVRDGNFSEITRMHMTRSAAAEFAVRLTTPRK